MDGTVHIPCLAPPIGSRVLGVRTADNQPPGINKDGQPGPDTQDIQSDTAMDRNAHGGTTAKMRSPGDAGGGLGRPAFGNIHGTNDKDHFRPDNRGVQVIFEVTKSNTTPNIGDSAVHQPTIDDGWGHA